MNFCSKDISKLSLILCMHRFYQNPGTFKSLLGTFGNSYTLSAGWVAMHLGESHFSLLSHVLCFGIIFLSLVITHILRTYFFPFCPHHIICLTEQVHNQQWSPFHPTVSISTVRKCHIIFQRSSLQYNVIVVRKAMHPAPAIRRMLNVPMFNKHNLFRYFLSPHPQQPD